MENKTYKILVLSDLKDAAHSTIKSTIGLAKMIGGEIEFFHVTRPTEVVHRESQLSAMRNISERVMANENKMKELLKPILLDNDINISYNYAIGNVKNEIKKRIKASQPDVIVLGKRKPKTINLMGDKLTEFILKHHDGAVLILSKKRAIDMDSQLSIGSLNDFNEALTSNFVKSLISKTKVPLKSFMIGDSSALSEDQSTTIDKKVVKYVFQDGPNAINTLTGYVTKNNISLFYVGRKNENQKQTIYTKNLIDKVGVSLLIG